jgi:hypothetical protein
MHSPAEEVHDILRGAQVFTHMCLHILYFSSDEFMHWLREPLVGWQVM